MDEDPDGDLFVFEGSSTMMGTWTQPEAIELLEEALNHASHLKPLWERIRVKEEGGRSLIGLPISSKVTDDTCDNHARHLWSLLNVLGLPLVPSPMALQRFDVDEDDLRPLIYVNVPAGKRKT